MFKKFANFVVKYRYYLLGLFIALMIASAFMIPHVKINYDFTKYLPENSSTRVALKVMEDEFGASGTASIMLENVTSETAKKLVQDLCDEENGVKGIATVSFDANDSACFKDNKALISVFFEKSDYSSETKQAIADLKAYLDEYDFVLGGSAVETSSNQDAIGNEIKIILLIAIAIVLAVLFITSRSWLEPLVYLIVIASAIVINMGTNLIKGEISFVTQSISSIMLIALVMDYCIVLCHRYREESEKTSDVTTAMTKALSGSFLAIVASSLTVIAGLVALMFMEFSIGFDIGFVLAKGVFIGVLAVLFLMPSIIMLLAKGIEKTRHRSFLPRLDRIGTFAKKTRFVMPILFVCIVAVGIYFQSDVNFTYVVENGAQGSAILQDNEKIEKTFGKQNSLVVMTGKNQDRDEQIRAEQKLYDYITTYFDDTTRFERNYITSSKSIASSELYVPALKKQDVFEKYGIEPTDAVTDAKISKVFEDLNKNAETDTVYLADLVRALYGDSDIVANAVNFKITTQFNNLFAPLNSTVAQTIYKLQDQNAMDEVFKSILGTTTLDASAVVPNYKILKHLYESGVYAQAQQPAQIVMGYMQAFAEIDAEWINDSYGVSQANLNAMFESMGKNVQTDKIQAYQFINYAKTHGEVITDIISTKQAVLNDGHQQLIDAENALVGANYTRMLFNVDLDCANEISLDFVRDLDTYLSQNFENAYIVSNSENVISTMDVFSRDKLKTDLITVLLIFLIVLLTFRSISIPVILVLAIQGAIWVNLGVSSIAGDSVYFICYLLAMAIQMGATIDYAILLTDRYMTARQKQNKFDAIKTAIDKSFTTVITSGTILIFAAFTIGWVSTIPLLKSIGILVGRGALMSVITILFILPQCLLIFDKVIEKTTLKPKFIKNTINNDNVVETTCVETTTAKLSKKTKKVKNVGTQDESIIDVQNQSETQTKDENIVESQNENLVRTNDEKIVKTNDDNPKE